MEGKLIRRALFVDRDGTINRDCPYCHDPKDLWIYEDAVRIMRNYQLDGYAIVMITNQSGINRGYFSESEMTAFNRALLLELEARGVSVNAIYFCPHRPDENCDCRKPKTGLVTRACLEMGIDLKASHVLGDRDDIDGEMARRLGIACTILRREG